MLTFNFSVQRFLTCAVLTIAFVKGQALQAQAAPQCGSTYIKTYKDSVVSNPASKSKKEYIQSVVSLGFPQNAAQMHDKDLNNCGKSAGGDLRLLSTCVDTSNNTLYSSFGGNKSRPVPQNIKDVFSRAAKTAEKLYQGCSQGGNNIGF
jgi:hypothetical protein